MSVLTLWCNSFDAMIVWVNFSQFCQSIVYTKMLFLASKNDSPIQKQQMMLQKNVQNNEYNYTMVFGNNRLGYYVCIKDMRLHSPESTNNHEHLSSVKILAEDMAKFRKDVLEVISASGMHFNTLYSCFLCTIITQSI